MVARLGLDFGVPALNCDDFSNFDFEARRRGLLGAMLALPIGATLYFVDRDLMVRRVADDAVRTSGSEIEPATYGFEELALALAAKYWRRA